MFRVNYFMPIGFLSLLIVAISPIAYGEPNLQTSISSNRIHLEETTSLVIQIDWPKSDSTYTFALPDIGLVNLALKNRAESQESYFKSGAEWSRKTFLLTLQPVNKGEGIIRSFNLGYTNPSTGEAGSFPVSEFHIQISPVPLDLKKLSFFIAIPLLLTAVYFLFRFIRRKKLKANEAMPAAITKEQKAILTIQEVLRKHHESPKETIFQLTSIFKDFLHDYYDIPQKQMTENELLDLLLERGLTRSELQPLRSLLDRLHQAKFMAPSMSSSDCEQLENEVLRFIESKKVLGQT